MRPAEGGTSADGRERVHEIARDVAAPARVDVDRNARFPHEAVDALRAAGLLGATTSPEVGGAGWSLGMLAESTTALAAACSSTGLIWAMHHSQVLTIERHAPPTAAWNTLRAEIAQGEILVASATSEPGSGADFLTSMAVLVPSGRPRTLAVTKDAATLSYGEQSDGILLTARRAPHESEDDIAFAFVRRADARVEARGTWDPMGMRGTAGPPMTVEAEVQADLVLPDPADVVLGRTMIPTAHILWGACWIGVARGAVDRARRAARARSSPSGSPPRSLQVLGDSAMALDQAEVLLDHAVALYAHAPPGDGLHATRTYNSLKVNLSSLTTTAVLGALRSIGMRGYMEDSDDSVAQSVRDILSAEIMVNNLRLREVNAQLEVLRRPSQNRDRSD